MTIDVRDYGCVDYQGARYAVLAQFEGRIVAGPEITLVTPYATPDSYYAVYVNGQFITLDSDYRAAYGVFERLMNAV